MIQVTYRDGSIERFDTEQFSHDREHKMFFVRTEHNKIMIPDETVKVIGAGHIETITIIGDEHCKKVEVFVYE